MYASLSARIPPGSGVSFLAYYHSLMKRDGMESKSLHNPFGKQLLVPRNGNESTENGWLGLLPDLICHSDGAAFDYPGR